ncbi:MAG: ABC transporter ATP-binding protein, partial [Oscillospiraceae bacterium]|nr:ABC transporter ATP-binding protein [Oscillospiraceae bacterium]
MRKEKMNPNIRAIKLWHSLCRSYFPLMIANAFFSNLSPYFNIYMSAEIVNEIAGARNTQRLLILVLIIVTGNFMISIFGGFLSREFGLKSAVLDQKEITLFNNKTLMLDYDNLENTEVRQLRRKIIESAKIDWHGKQSLINSLNNLTYNVINIILSVYLFTEMLILIVSAEFSWIFLMFFGMLILLIALNVWVSFFVEKKIAYISNDVSQTMIDENRIDDALDSYNMGKDVRLYRQDKLVMKIKNISFDLHKKAFRKLFSEKFKSEIPIQVLSYLLQATTYIFVCIYAIKEVFGIGSIIKYIGFIRRLINAVIYMFNIIGEIKYNTPFIVDYLAFFDIQQKMYLGTLPVEKRSLCVGGDNDYEIEFRDVSFKYPSSDAYALRNVSLKFRIGERLAVVGMNGSGKTTFIKLLCRLYDPTEGEILLNGINIK